MPPQLGTGHIEAVRGRTRLTGGCIAHSSAFSLSIAIHSASVYLTSQARAHRRGGDDPGAAWPGLTGSIDWGPGGDSYLTPLSAPRSIRGAQSTEESEPRTVGCCRTPPTPYTSWTGREHRYFLGLVDLTTVYGLPQAAGATVEDAALPRPDLPTVSPACYARRLCQWVEAHTE